MVQNKLQHNIELLSWYIQIM